MDSGLIATNVVKGNKKLESIQVTDNLIQCNAKQVPNEITNQAGGKAIITKVILEKLLKECLNLSMMLAAFARME